MLVIDEGGRDSGQRSTQEGCGYEAEERELPFQSLFPEKRPLQKLSLAVIVRQVWLDLFPF